CCYCQEVCPEEAIFLMQDYSLTGTSREEMIYNQEKLLALGGAHQDKIRKWKKKPEEAVEQAMHPSPLFKIQISSFEIQRNFNFQIPVVVVEAKHLGSGTRSCSVAGN